MPRLVQRMGYERHNAVVTFRVCNGAEGYLRYEALNLGPLDVLSWGFTEEQWLHIHDRIDKHILAHWSHYQR